MGWGDIGPPGRVSLGCKKNRSPRNKGTEQRSQLPSKHFVNKQKDKALNEFESVLLK